MATVCTHNCHSWYSPPINPCKIYHRALCSKIVTKSNVNIFPNAYAGPEVDQKLRAVNESFLPSPLKKESISQQLFATYEIKDQEEVFRMTYRIQTMLSTPNDFVDKCYVTSRQLAISGLLVARQHLRWHRKQRNIDNCIKFWLRTLWCNIDQKVE